eukprot:TRINITY_DN62028_c0_g1_i3.p3 TRINITY_DN62028_c0_g1~~TRINITY_DN62028_c0_g1_i3.p3  ORF type:complete len:142 (+),score=19.37 TRINITY_DN62028_c0_g1_i3:377-802(+)
MLLCRGRSTMEPAEPPRVVATPPNPPAIRLRVDAANTKLQDMCLQMLDNPGTSYPKCFQDTSLWQDLLGSKLQFVGSSDEGESALYCGRNTIYKYFFGRLCEVGNGEEDPLPTPNCLKKQFELYHKLVDEQKCNPSCWAYM